MTNLDLAALETIVTDRRRGSVAAAGRHRQVHDRHSARSPARWPRLVAPIRLAVRSAAGLRPSRLRVRARLRPPAAPTS